MNSKETIKLKLKANSIRQNIIKMLNQAGSGHSAGSLGMADIFTALYFKFLNIKPKKPDWPKRDYLVLSNGHICPAMYASMAKAGYFPEQELSTLRKTSSRLPGHPHRESLPGIETSSGPLGCGLSQAAGMALAIKMDKKKNKVFCITSDGEHQEGNTWEGVMFASKYGLDNLINIVDRNFIQIDGPTQHVMPLGSLKEKYHDFGWNVMETEGNNMEKVLLAIEKALTLKEKPTVIIAKTVPGNGVSFMENNYKWHGKAPNNEETEKALQELEQESRFLEQELVKQ